MWSGFISSVLLVTVAEFGDKTFFLPLILAMRHSRRMVFLGSWSALVLMSVLAVGIGQLLLSLLPLFWIRLLSSGLFVGFGLKMLWQAWQMSPQIMEIEEADEALELVEAAESHGAGVGGDWAVIWEAFSLTAMAEWGDKTQIATLSLAAAHPGLSVMAGATLGHGIMTALAVIGGRMIASRVSERAVLWVGGILFLVFAVLTGWELGLDP
ncbi:MAG: TMEM165/GDT1 family protein [Synechococcaceae cyanobacterium SM2_3_2]|nr:TMEM165/GDT1 family protein [Synechococcaceae cyanobacterium SM2_3_2]